MILYLIMQKIDLGGHPIIAFTNEELAIQKINELNESYNENQIQRLITDCNYTKKQAEQWIKNHGGEYYIEEVNLT